MRAMKKLVMFMLVVLMMTAAPQVYAAGNAAIADNGSVINQNIVFIDVQNHWANDAIYDMAQKGYISGYQDNSFKPEKPITREEFAKLISVTFSLDLVDVDTPSFSDVQRDRWSFKYVEAAKEFLTGYYPPKGKPFFSPATKATREDVAVALVKVLGYTPDDLQDPYILDRNFSDVDSISYNLRDYVAIATENRLIQGYEDGTFRPENPITRAEVATLLYRVIKDSSHDQGEGLKLEVSVPEKTTTGTFSVEGSTSRNAKVTINGSAVKVDDGRFKELYKLDEEGRHTITITAKLPSGQEKSVTKTIVYQIDGPQLRVNDVPETTTKETITISGTVTDKNDSYPVVYLNDEKVSVSSYNGSFSEEVKLQEGVNKIVVRAVNKQDKSTVVTKTITFNAGGPNLQVNSIPEQTANEKLTVSGTVTDKNDGYPTLYINDQKVSVSSYNGSFSEEYTLRNGENTFVFKAVNKNGKETVVTKRVTFNADGPVLRVNDLPAVSTNETITISGTVTDKNDSYPTVYLNDEKLYVASYNGAFSQEVKLKEGVNTFTIRATNKAGKSSKVTKSIEFSVGAPVLQVKAPDVSKLKEVTITGSVSDKNDSYPTVYMNGEKLYVAGYDGSFSETVTLKDNENTFVFKAVNKIGKETTVTKVIKYVPGGPVLQVNDIPATTTSNTITISGSVSDDNDSRFTVYLNDEAIISNSYYNSFSKEVTLTEGVNTFVIRAVNSAGLSTSVTKTITFTVEGPALVVGYAPETTTNPEFTLTGSVTDKNDSRPQLYLNDVLINVDWNGSFSKKVQLKEGANVFTFTAANKLGKTTTVVKTIFLQTAPPAEPGV
ncbi:S-layer homology domain-containing protein [Paenibacillus marinisediminis]